MGHLRTRKGTPVFSRIPFVSNMVPKAGFEPAPVGFNFLFEESRLPGPDRPQSSSAPSSLTADFRLGVPCASEMHASKITTSSAARRLDRSDVDLFHLHHRIESTLGGGGVGIGYRFGQSDRRNLPGQAPFVLAPAAHTLFAAVADDGVPVTIRFGLVSGCDLKRECQVVLDLGSADEPEAGNSHYRKLDRQHISFLSGRKVPRCEVHRAHK